MRKMHENVDCIAFNEIKYHFLDYNTYELTCMRIGR